MQTKIHEPTQIVEVMLTHAEQADEFTELLTRERRIQDNLALLQWAFVGMVEMIKARMESSSSDEHALNEKFWEAVHRSVRKQVTEFRMIQSKFKEGNIAFLLCEAIDSDEFDLCRKKTNLFKRNGIIWKEKKGVIKQVGIKQTALVQFIRNQNGYQNYSSRKITDYMKDIGGRPKHDVTFENIREIYEWTSQKALDLAVFKYDEKIISAS